MEEKNKAALKTTWRWIVYVVTNTIVILALAGAIALVIRASFILYHTHNHLVTNNVLLDSSNVAVAEEIYSNVAEASSSFFSDPSILVAFATFLLCFVTFALFIVGWRQLIQMGKTSRADFLLQLDKRYSSPEIMEARISLQELISKSGQKTPLEIAKILVDEMDNLNEKTDRESCKKFIFLRNFLEFLETVAYFGNKGFISSEEINELIGATLCFNYDIFKRWIYQHRGKPGNKKYCSELEDWVDANKKVL